MITVICQKTGLSDCASCELRHLHDYSLTFICRNRHACMHVASQMLINWQPVSDILSLTNLSLTTCQWQPVSKKLSLTTCLRQTVAEGLSLTTCYWTHFTDNHNRSMTICLWYTFQEIMSLASSPWRSAIKAMTHQWSVCRPVIDNCCLFSL